MLTSKDFPEIIKKGITSIHNANTRKDVSKALYYVAAATNEFDGDIYSDSLAHNGFCFGFNLDQWEKPTLKTVPNQDLIYYMHEKPVMMLSMTKSNGKLIPINQRNTYYLPKKSLHHYHHFNILIPKYPSKTEAKRFMRNYLFDATHFINGDYDCDSGESEFKNYNVTPSKMDRFIKEV